jgi:hypothetical protein
LFKSSNAVRASATSTMSGVFLETRLDANGTHPFLYNRMPCLYYTAEARHTNQSLDRLTAEGTAVVVTTRLSASLVSEVVVLA